MSMQALEKVRPRSCQGALGDRDTPNGIQIEAGALIISRSDRKELIRSEMD